MIVTENTMCSVSTTVVHQKCIYRAKQQPLSAFIEPINFKYIRKQFYSVFRSKGTWRSCKMKSWKQPAIQLQLLSEVATPFPSITLSHSPLAFGFNPTYCQMGVLAFLFDNKCSAIVLSDSCPHPRYVISEMWLLLLCAATLLPDACSSL